MMDVTQIVNVITTAVSNVGFPIVCVAVLFYLQNKEREAHKEESQKLAEALNNNTVVMEKILTKLGDAQ